MSERIHALALQLTGKPNLDECSVDELQLICQRFPYFASAQFLLLQKLRADGRTEEATAQYRKAVLYYHNPLLFEAFLSPERFVMDEAGWAKAIEPETNEAVSVAVPTTAGTAEDIAPLETAVSPPTTDTTTQELTEAVELLPAETDDGDNDKVSSDTESPDATEPHNEGIAHAETSVADTDETTTTIQVVESTPAVPNHNDALSFEPFHTVDYFASQGIRYSAESAPKDKLGQQLKSFTEWLKTMKRLPSQQLATATESQAEQKVEKLASNSVSESDVVTEAMAEVWVKQGNAEKAAHIYEKLSLLNPSKRAYFAAKIETLKQS